MSNAPEIAGADLKRRAMRIGDFLDQIADLQADLKIEKKPAKENGYDLAALMKVVRELRMEPEKREAQLEFELVVDTYRKGVGLDTVNEIGIRQAVEKLDSGDTQITIEMDGMEPVTLGGKAGAVRRAEKRKQKVEAMT